ncbi:MAG TPA: sterol desaturase family protein [Polyangiaceae bacterium]|jgi:sterol desaturase/sphingolipid hydroxylase (fatty acid hydroxylase superfamily)|nr:sterol desaturase family protein [Polyangiaceae bacterium]
MLGIPIGLAVANLAEWLIHKHVLHGKGRVRGTFWSFHWHEHHRNARASGFVDHDYERSPFAWNAQGKEALGLVGMSLLVTPLLPIAPFFVMTSYYSSYRYYRAHKRAHQDPAWARENVPWHYDHHMGPDQDANWCVTRPWFDHVMGTRKPYIGTEREQADEARRARRVQS